MTPSDPRHFTMSNATFMFSSREPRLKHFSCYKKKVINLLCNYHNRHFIYSDFWVTQSFTAQIYTINHKQYFSAVTRSFSHHKSYLCHVISRNHDLRYAIVSLSDYMNSCTEKIFDAKSKIAEL